MRRQPDTGTTARLDAARRVLEWIQTQRLPDMHHVAAAHRGSVRQSLYGVVKRSRSLRWAVHRFAPRPPLPEMNACLWTGAHEILWTENADHYAVVNETVEVAKQLCGRKAAAFANAIMRRIATDHDTLLRDLRKRPLGLRESHPELLIRRWRRHLGNKRTQALCRWNNGAPVVAIRPDTSRTDAAAFQARLLETGTMTTPHPFAPDRCLVLPPGTRVTGLYGYGRGLFYVQDPSALAPIDLLAPQPGESMVDLCAAPGGKTLHLAEKVGPKGNVLAIEESKARLDRLQQNVTRSRKGWIDVRLSDATVDREPPTFDGALVDAPCTNTGVLRRRPDARWRFSENKLADLTGLQNRLLDAAARRVRPGGRIVYSVCSLEPEEGDHRVRQFLRRHPEYQLQQETLLVPPETETDGGYSALLIAR